MRESFGCGGFNAAEHKQKSTALLQQRTSSSPPSPLARASPHPSVRTSPDPGWAAEGGSTPCLS